MGVQPSAIGTAAQSVTNIILSGLTKQEFVSTESRDRLDKAGKTTGKSKECNHLQDSDDSVSYVDLRNNHSECDDTEMLVFFNSDEVLTAIIKNEYKLATEWCL